jgi:hypothetical protein
VLKQRLIRLWNGVKDHYVDILINPLSADLASLNCPSVAYSIDLRVWSTSTNGYSSRLYTQYHYAVVGSNLVVSEQ